MMIETTETMAKPFLPVSYLFDGFRPLSKSCRNYYPPRSAKPSETMLKSRRNQTETVFAQATETAETASLIGRLRNGFARSRTRARSFETILKPPATLSPSATLRRRHQNMGAVKAELKLGIGGLVMGRRRERVRLEDGLKLDLNKLLRDGLVKPGAIQSSSIRWYYVGSGETIASGAIASDMLSEPFGWLRLRLGGLDQRIQLRAVARHFGGAQWYFICPARARDASVLWLPPGGERFVSRQAWGRQVAYGSQFQTWNDRALSRAQDIRYRLGGRDDISLDGLIPPKPKGMHWRTYERQLKRCEAYEMKCNLYLLGLIARLKNRRI